MFYPMGFSHDIIDEAYWIKYEVKPQVNQTMKNQALKMLKYMYEIFNFNIFVKMMKINLGYKSPIFFTFSSFLQVYKN